MIQEQQVRAFYTRRHRAVQCCDTGAGSIWLAGGGIKGGLTYGATDEFGYNAVEDVVHVNDLHATILRFLGIDHKRLTYRFQGHDFRLTDVAGNVIQKILA